MRKPVNSATTEGFVLPDLCDYQALLILMVVAQLMAFAFTVYAHGFAFDWGKLGLISIYVQSQSLLSAIVLCKVRSYLSALPQVKGVMLAYGILLAIALVISLAAAWWLRPMHQGEFAWPVVARNLFLSAILIGITLRYLYVQQQVLLKEKVELTANLVALQARIRPHFLFNTLNSIASLISFDPDSAEKMVEDLSALIRASLQDNVIETSIREEWALCQRYLEIEQLRLGDRMQWECDFFHLDQDLMIPHLSLQPIIENGIYHGIQADPNGGKLQVKGGSQDNQVTITVKNSKPKVVDKGRAGKGNKVAIKNIRHRIEQLYGKSARLYLKDEDTYFMAILTYTCNKA